MFGCIIIRSQERCFLGAYLILVYALGVCAWKTSTLTRVINVLLFMSTLLCLFLLCGSGAITVERGGVGWLGSYSFYPLCPFGMFDS